MSEPKRQLYYYDIFVPGGSPEYTYNPRAGRALENKVQGVMKNLYKLVIVTGNTKSGKTVLVEKVLTREFAIWVEGGGVEDENDFWSTVSTSLDLFPITELHDGDGSLEEVGVEVSAEVDVLAVKGGTKIAGKAANTDTRNKIATRTVSPKSAALAALRQTRKPLVIDDFHYLPKKAQGNIIRALKPLIYMGVPVVIIAIPHRRYDAVKVEKEMTGRILPVDIPLWSNEELSFIPCSGFKYLNTNPASSIVQSLVEQSLGSPHLMQQFCREICEISNILSSHTDSNQIKSSAPLEAFPVVAETIGRPIFEKLASGPRQRSDRKQRSLKDGTVVDIYSLVLGGLAHIKPGMITLEYEDLRSAIKEICEPDDVPNVHEIARVLKKMAEIAATDESSTPVIDFDEEDKKLHITDPFFAFYLRWGVMTGSR